ncbi:hypothetical protein [Spiroplasma citri]|uniref:Uncharacterized protein n=1 Tax=Spiroplasma citri TaxID=2133 RepID=A0AAJ4JXW5_SPICI|nr:hypothetical protein [Spiroplasma citri]APE74463.1 hypothetical protein SCITRI_00564 [Spiroplasma citri]QED24383.1 hypothetical protein FRX96_02625 [Spiroplasma citri]QIA66649.1 hypothetical protein GMI18_02630 [Spiroplasma citri]QIA68533.1 hypothetical protein GL298_02750 [Spiroplasma citri]QIA70406.1 hypothetical protein GL981_02750 [Spiroplasma citri]
MSNFKYEYKENMTQDEINALLEQKEKQILSNVLPSVETRIKTETEKQYEEKISNYQSKIKEYELSQVPQENRKLVEELLNSGKDMEYVKTNFKDLIEKKPQLDMKNLMNGGIQIKDENMFIEELSQKIKENLQDNHNIPINERIKKLVQKEYQKGK